VRRKQLPAYESRLLFFGLSLAGFRPRQFSRSVLSLIIKQMKLQAFIILVLTISAFASLNLSDDDKFSAFSKQTAELPADTDLPAPRLVIKTGLERNNYLAPLLELRSREAEYLASEKYRTEYLDYMTELCSYVGEYDAAYSYEEMFLSDLDTRTKRRARNAKDLTSSPIDGYKPFDAVAAIASVAEKQQVMMINEEHRTPVHRALTLRLLPILYTKGFRYFAAETVDESDTDLNRRGYPTQKTGYYTADPVYADVIRTALKLGYKVVPYEYTSTGCQPKPDNPFSCQEERERGQAQNLVDRILKKDPQAKIFVHVGRSHNAKIKYEGQFAAMGWHFRDISKINPFVIDQVMMSERRNPMDENPLYRYAVKKWQMTEPTIFQSAAGDYWTDNKDAADARVFQPRAQYQNGRPTWLKMGGLRKSYRINLKKLKLQMLNEQFGGREPILIQAFFAKEPDDAIPVDQIVLYPEKSIPSLTLPKGAMRLRAIDKSGKTVGQYDFRLK
jgi:hypothetical protein